jgi:hypothetical protein
MPRVRVSPSAEVIAYFLAMACLGALGLQLSATVTANVIGLTLPHLLDKSPRKPSRIEQRRIDAAQAVSPMPGAFGKRVVALEASAVPYVVLAAQLDLAEAQQTMLERQPLVPSQLPSAAPLPRLQP